MDPLLDLGNRLTALPSYWEARIECLASECRAAGSKLSLQKLLFSMRDMPYERPIGNSNTAQECITQWRGTCSAKHLAAYEALKSLGFRPKMWLASYRIDFNKPYYSEKLRSQAAGLSVYDVHNYLVCRLGGSRPIIIDITFPVNLGAQGFPVTESWTGDEDFVLCCRPEKNLEIKDMNQADGIKRDWLRDLNSSNKELEIRENAILELMQAATKRPQQAEASALE